VQPPQRHAARAAQLWQHRGRRHGSAQVAQQGRRVSLHHLQRQRGRLQQRLRLSVGGAVDQPAGVSTEIEVQQGLVGAQERICRRQARLELPQGVFRAAAVWRWLLLARRGENGRWVAGMDVMNPTECADRRQR